MYTISLRPYCPGGIPKQCMNFVQEQLRWDLSTFSEESGVPSFAVSPMGITFASPLQSVDMTVKQLAAMVSGLGEAFVGLCNALYQHADEDLLRSEFCTMEEFSQCVIGYPTYLKLPRAVVGDVFPGDVQPVPFLYSSAEDLCLGWTGRRWGTYAPPSDLKSYDLAGTCFDWDVLYSESRMSTDCVQSPMDLASMLCYLLEATFSEVTVASWYVYNIHNVRRV